MADFEKGTNEKTKDPCGICGVSVTWAFHPATGELIISGAGAMTDYDGDYAPWSEAEDNIQTVRVEEGVTAISDGAFSYCKNLTTVILPNTMGSIGREAFHACKRLSHIIIPAGVFEIREDAFTECPCLDAFQVDEKNPFYTAEDGVLFCKSMARLIQYPANRAQREYAIPQTVTDIESSAFYGCKMLSTITMSDQVNNIGEGAFCNCTDLTELVIPNGVTRIQPITFLGCRNLQRLAIPNSVTSIGEYALSGCSNLTCIALPEDLVELQAGAFSECDHMAAIQICGNNPNFRLIDGVLFNGDGTELLLYPAARIHTDYAVPNGVAEIGAHAFDSCEKLVRITTPQGVIRIGEHAFFRCSNLEEVALPDSMASIGAAAFMNCGKLSEIRIPNGMTDIASASFCGCTEIKTIAIGIGIESIGFRAFYGCKALPSVTIPSGVNGIWDEAFAECTALSTIAFEGTPPHLFDASAFHSCAEGFTVFYYASVANAWAAADPALWDAYAKMEIPKGVLPSDLLAFGTCGDGVQWALTKDGRLTIGGNGEMAKYTSREDVPWHEYVHAIRVIDVQNGVSHSERLSLAGCARLFELTLPNTVIHCEP